MAQLTHCPRVRMRPQRVHKCSRALPSIHAETVLVEVLSLLDRCCCVACQRCKQSRGMGRGREALLLLRACEKLMSANSHRDAAPWISHLGNFICFWRVTSFLRVRSDRDEIPWGSPSWQLSPLLEPRVFTSCKTYPLSQARAPSVCHACTRSCFCRMQSCGRDGTLRFAILMLVQ